MGDGLTNADGSPWERKIQAYLDDFDSLVKRILIDEPQLKCALIDRLTQQADESRG